MMQRPTGGPDRGGYRPPSREQLAAEQRKALRRTGYWLIGGGLAVAALGTFTSIDSLNHGLGQQTVLQHVFPQLSYDGQFNTGIAGIGIGAVSLVSGIGLAFANQEPSRF